MRNAYCDVVVAGRGRFGKADPAVLGVGEAGARHHVVADLAGRTHKGVLGRDAAFEAGHLDQHGSAVDVARGEDVVDFGAQVGVDWDSLSLGPDAGGLKRQLLDIGGPSDGEKYRVHEGFCHLGRGGVFDDEPLLLRSYGVHHGIGVRFDAPALERPLQFNRDAGVGLRHDGRTGFEQADGGAQIGQDGGDLASGVGRADDGRGRR